MTDRQPTGAPDPAVPGHIVTFYSFKGGTGRTMAMANVAWILAANGRRVLAIDWDLESPGLHHYFRPFLTDKMLRHSRGVIDLIRDFAAAAINPMADHEGPDWYHRYADVEREAVSLNWPFPDRGGIDLLPAGQQDPTYSNTVSTFDWAAFYDRLNGSAYLRALRDKVRDRYDFILIDSRTGLSDSAGICTVDLPDTLVNCFTLNDQSIDGATAVAESILSQRETEPIRILPIPMRVEDAELFKLEAGRDHARYRFEPYLRLSRDEADAYWSTAEIPYKPFFAYEEILAVFGERSRQEGSLLSAFERLTDVITRGEVTELPALDERERRRWLLAYERQKPARGYDTLISYVSIDRTWADWIANHLEEVGQQVTLREVDLVGDLTGAAAAGTDVRTHIEAGGRVVVVLSQDYLRSPNAPGFWRAAGERDLDGRGLIPVRIDSGRIGPPFSDRQPLVDLVNVPEDRARDTLLAVFDRALPARAGSRRHSRQGPRYPATHPPVWEVPPRNATFTGRSSILEGLRDRLSASVTVVVPQALFGLGGVGKSQVALEYAHRFAADYDVVWWIGAEQPSLVGTSLADLCQRLRIPAGETTAERVRAVLEALRLGEPYRRWLLVFDNANSPEEIAEYLPQGSGHVLVTSRNVTWNPLAASVEVGTFTRGESIALLRRRVPELPLEAADQVAEKLGDLPLAIEQAGAWLAVTGMPVERYLELLDTQLLEVLSSSPPTGYPRTAAATWRLSLERIREEMPAAAKLLEVCAFFAPEPIPMWLLYSERFTRVLLPLDPTLNEPLLQGRLVQEIGRYALAKVDSGQASVQLHRLVQAVIRDGLSETDRQENRVHVQEILAAANPRFTDEPEFWSKYRQIRQHLEPTGALSSLSPAVRHLVIDLVRYLWKAGDYDASESLGHRALASWRELSPGDDDLTTLWLRLHLGNTIRSQARYSEAYETDADVYRRLLDLTGPDHPYAIMSLSSQAADLHALGQHQQARSFGDEALARSVRILGEDNYRTTNAMNNLALSLRIVGDFAKAVELDERAYELRHKQYGLDHPVSLLYAGNLGRDYRELGRYQRAEEILSDTLERSRRVLGHSHPETLQIAKALAVTLRKLGDVQAGHDLSQDTLGRLRKVLGDDHPHTLACASNFACDLSALGDDQAARTTAEETLARYRGKLGNDHAFTLACQNNLTIFLRRVGEHETARPLAEHVVERVTAKLGPDHPHTLACVLNLANEYFDLGDHQAALRLDRDANRRLTVALGPDHPDTLASANNLAISLRTTGQRSEGQEIFQDVLERSRTKLGADHLNTVAVRNGIRLNCDIDPPQI